MRILILCFMALLLVGCSSKKISHEEYVQKWQELHKNMISVFL